jgi:SAM-dependent methyltransferase
MAKTPCGKELVAFAQKGTPIVGRWADKAGELMGCPECGYLVFDPLPTNDELGTYYGSQYWELGGSFEEARQSYEIGGSYKDAAGEIAQIWSDLGIQGQQLRAHEIGCGYGVAVKFMREAGIEATGSDLSTSAIEIARKLGNPHTEAQPLTQYLAGRPNDKINLFYMSHSLEHMPQPSETVDEVFDHLDPGGVFFIRVPNGMHLTSRFRSFYEYTWLQFPDHIHYFTPKSAICLLEAAGFEIVKITTRLREEHPQMMMSATIGRTWHDLPDPSSFIRGVCDNWLGMELQIIARKPAGGAVAGAPEGLKAAADRFEAHCDDMGLAEMVPGDNLALFDARINDSAAWRYSDVTDPDNVEVLTPHVDGKRLVSTRGQQVHRALHFVPQDTSLRVEHVVAADPAGKNSSKLVKIAISAILPHDQDGAFELTISHNGQRLARETHVSGRRHSRELVVKAKAGDIVTFDLKTTKSEWPSLYVHAAVRWFELAKPMALEQVG